ncbi:hypothetical protein [Roseimicrobium sp. ORNL1]|uniref:hypothetical protein n=1 Tax=Roseimicrobium sp. ORNL1 TaxID=2711231 RepID=UPI0013E182C1|nr:hypothetical protein [Roseimicrobium sp. ORNL1]QIF04947.1 hypothetical protein G5S37_26665 [Roseimicrobium sp. ORNL1]
MSTVFESVLKHLKARHHDEGELARLVHEDVVIDDPTSSEPAPLEEFLKWWPHEVSILHSVSSETDGAVVFEHLHSGTGMPARTSWHLEFHDQRISKVVVGGQHAHILYDRSLHRKRDRLLSDFGFRHFDATRDSRELLKRADAALEEERGCPLEYSSSDVLLNEELLYIPFPFLSVGSSGYLVDRKTFHAESLGSAFDVAIHVWAHYRGFAKGLTGDERGNDLVITAVRDWRATENLFRNIFGGKAWKEFLPGLKNLPFRICNVDLYRERDNLWKAELRGWFRFEITPPTVTNEDADENAS